MHAGYKCIKNIKIQPVKNKLKLTITTKHYKPATVKSLINFDMYSITPLLSLIAGILLFCFHKLQQPFCVAPNSMPTILCLTRKV